MERFKEMGEIVAGRESLKDDNLLAGREGEGQEDQQVGGDPGTQRGR